jgi:CheY-like chemotaxis protein/HPt (histidine-containing phosphotransfer) domain-containing protein
MYGLLWLSGDSGVVTDQVWFLRRSKKMRSETDLLHAKDNADRSIRGKKVGFQARKLEIESADFDLYSVVEDVTGTTSKTAAEKSLHLACLTMPDVPRRVKGDPQRIKQLLVNLVTNAINSTKSGSISIRVTLDEQFSDYVTVRFSITDTGTGISAERMDRLFMSSSQAPSSTVGNCGGTGLAISKQLAELMGGTIGVQSAAGHGSTFWFTVRLQRPVPALVAAAAIDLRGLRVLAVHDSPMFRQSLRTQLGAWGLAIATAPSGATTMKMLMEAAAMQCPYRVAILDSELPDINTLELGKAIKARPEIAGSVLLVLLTANSGFEPAKLRAAGFSGHLIKPLRQRPLYDSIADAMTSTFGPGQIVAGATDGNRERSLETAAPTLIVDDGTPPVAIDALLKHCMGESATVTSILNEFERQAVADLAELTRLVKSGDCAGTARVAHALKGASGSLSADALAGIAFQIEQMGRAGAIIDEGLLLSRLNDEVRRCIDYLPEVRSAIAKGPQV